MKLVVLRIMRRRRESPWPSREKREDRPQKHSGEKQKLAFKSHENLFQNQSGWVGFGESPNIRSNTAERQKQPKRIEKSLAERQIVPYFPVVPSQAQNLGEFYCG
jgi:hypothetical protein